MRGAQRSFYMDIRVGNSNSSQGQRVKGIVLDFDGVILESNRIKAESFRRLFSQYPHHGDKIVQLHADHGGMPRFEKLRIICRDIIQQPVDDAGIARLSKKLGEIADEQLMTCPFTPGALQFLKTYSTRYALFIASGTPEDEMQDLTKRRGLDGFFKGVYGSPRNKGAILRDILAQNGWLPQQLVFIGDAIDDYKGAEEAHVPFIARIAPERGNPLDAKKVKLIVSDLRELDRHWQDCVEGQKGAIN